MANNGEITKDGRRYNNHITPIGVRMIVLSWIEERERKWSREEEGRKGRVVGRKTK